MRTTTFFIHNISQIDNKIEEALLERIIYSDKQSGFI